MKELAHKNRSAWEVYASAKERKAMRSLAENYVDFISRCKTERETISYVEERLRTAGLKPGMGESGGFQTLYGKALFAVRRGKRPLSEGVRLISASTRETCRLMIASNFCCSCVLISDI